ncbi:MAG: hypothetical protein AAF404_03605 [Pseudomonadota bacterium]
MLKQLAVSAALTVSLSACDGDKDLVSRLTTQLGAAGEHPCASYFDYEIELNGIADDTRQSSTELDGEVIVTEQHWYGSLEMIVYYTYAEGGTWCNTWNESGVSWN